ncbi:hypothetical protein TNCV_2217841 [Trichonephila clavipes]|nr:hypothetical protein TNCV_2217841 [Trichonephila clavipes]
MLCLQDNLSTNTTIADFYTPFCVRLWGLNDHVSSKTISLSYLTGTIVVCRKQCHSLVATVATGNLKTLSLLIRHESLGFRSASEVEGTLRDHRFHDILYVCRPIGYSFADIKNLTSCLQRLPNFGKRL